jgi:uncharacterized protein
MNVKNTKTVLITGASSGIGYELAKLFACDRCNLILTARSEQTLKDIADDFNKQFGASVKIIPKDLSAPNAPQEIWQELQQEGIKIDILVNNAGFATYGFFVETDLDPELRMMQLNMVALTHLTKLFLPDMIAQKEGKILNIASTAAFQPGPLMAVYFATKAYVLSFSEAIANELAGSGVTVTALCPGPTESGFQARANMERSKLFGNNRIMDAKTVAEIGYRSLKNDRTVVIAGLKNNLLALGVKFLPRNLIAKIVRNMQEKV